MAGAGKRFKDKGYDLPKYKILIKKKTMFEWALTSLKNFFDKHFIFIALYDENIASDFIKDKCKKLNIKKYDVILLDKITSGQAETVLKAEQYVEEDDFLIYNIDTYVKPSEINKKDIKGDGWIPCFKAVGNHWSFVKFNNKLKVNEVTEKIRISGYGTIGLYYFKSIDLFREAYTNYYKRKENTERYIAPIYNYLIKKKKTVYTTILDKNKIHVLGTPKEVMKFESR